MRDMFKTKNTLLLERRLKTTEENQERLEQRLVECVETLKSVQKGLSIVEDINKSLKGIITKNNLPVYNLKDALNPEMVPVGALDPDDMKAAADRMKGYLHMREEQMRRMKRFEKDLELEYEAKLLKLKKEHNKP